jgi:hypothetical protein
MARKARSAAPSFCRMFANVIGGPKFLPRALAML